MRLEKRRPRLVRRLKGRRAAAQTDTPEKLAEHRPGAGDRDPGEAARDASIRGAVQSAPSAW